ncbi:MAG: hypothetical protein DRI57_22415 [Deltaproteobacteria bacterium]|nr:MAG: hypothetical protein DRI57_22415 [Deltaproteobacteria bacterium]
MSSEITVLKFITGYSCRESRARKGSGNSFWESTFFSNHLIRLFDMGFYYKLILYTRHLLTGERARLCYFYIILIFLLFIS